jgi:hypothetical protein
MPFIMFIPGPLMWNTVARHDPSWTWVVSCTTLAVLPISTLPRVTTRRAALLGIVGGCFAFLSNINLLTIVLPIVTAVLLLTVISSRRQSLFRKHVVYSLSTLIPGLLALPVFIGSYLFSVWRIPEIAVAENVAEKLDFRRILQYLLPMPRLGSDVFGNDSILLLLRGIALGVLVWSIWLVRRKGHRRLAQIGIHSLWMLTSYASVYIFGIAVFHREFGADPNYVQIFAYPVWILLLTTSMLSLPVQTLKQFPAIAVALPAVLIVLWTAQWLVRNYDNRVMPAEYPITLSNTTRDLMSRMDHSTSELDIERVILVQAQFPPERAGEGFEIRRSSDFSETFLMELSAARIPVLNAYSHMISPVSFELTNEHFGDGRPSVRQFSLYDRVNSERLADFGIRFVLSEVPIEDSRLLLLSQEPFLAHGLFPTSRIAHLYEVLPSSSTPDDGLIVSIDKSLLRLRGTFQTPLERTIPVEFSNCLRVRSTDSTGSVVMSRGADSMLHLRLVGEIDAEIEYRNSIFQVVNCRIRDFFDYQKLTDES